MSSLGLVFDAAMQADLMQDEGVKLVAYPDSRGFLTIGIGRMIDERKGGGISVAEAKMLCDNDVSARVVSLINALPWFASLDPVRQSALVNVAFNLGVNGLLEFHKMLAAVAAGDWVTATDELHASLWATQVQASRVSRIARYLETGVR